MPTYSIAQAVAVQFDLCRRSLQWSAPYRPEGETASDRAHYARLAFARIPDAPSVTWEWSILCQCGAESVYGPIPVFMRRALVCDMCAMRHVRRMLSVARNLELTAAQVHAIRADEDASRVFARVSATRSFPRFRTGPERTSCQDLGLEDLVCEVCREGANDCSCETRYRSGELFQLSECDECGESYDPESGPECSCGNEDEDEDNDPVDRYRCADHAIQKGGEKTTYAPYYIGIEVETDSCRDASGVNGFTAVQRLCSGTGRDGSVDGYETRTQPLRGEMIVEAICEIAEFIHTEKLNPRTGLHMHVDFSQGSTRARSAHVRLFAACEDALFEIAGEHRREGIYTKAIKDSAGLARMCLLENSADRYTALNILSFSEHKTHELRLWGWTAEHRTDAECARWIYDRMRVTQALRLAAHIIGDEMDRSIPVDEHPIFGEDDYTILALCLALVPHIPAGVEPLLDKTTSSLGKWGA